MAEDLFEHTTGQGKEDKDSNEEMEALKFSEKMIDDKIIVLWPLSDHYHL